MGFEARKMIADVLDAAIKDETAQVRVTAYDLNLPEIVDKLELLKGRLKIIIDDSVDVKNPKPTDHGNPASAETAAAKRLSASAGRDNHPGRGRSQSGRSAAHQRDFPIDVHTVDHSSFSEGWDFSGREAGPRRTRHRSALPLSAC